MNVLIFHNVNTDIKTTRSLKQTVFEFEHIVYSKNMSCTPTLIMMPLCISV